MVVAKAFSLGEWLVAEQGGRNSNMVEMQIETNIKEEVNLLSRLDRLPVTRTSKTSAILLIFMWIGVAFCNGLMAPELLLLKQVWILTKQDIALLGISCTVGVVIGAFVVGRLADQYGRKKVLIYNVWLSLLATVACALIPDVRWMVAMRFISGIGLGMLFPVPYVMISELVGAKSRGTMIGIANGILVCSYSIPNLTGVWIMNSFSPETAWRIPFILAGIFVITAFLLAKWLPESPRWLLQQGRNEEVRKLVNKLEDEAGFEHDFTLMAPGILQAVQRAEQKQDGKLVRLFRPPLLGRFIMSFIVCAGCVTSNYVVTIYFPMLIAAKGLSSTNALALTACFNLLALLGALNVGRLTVAWGNKKFFLLYSLLTVFGYILMTQSIIIMLIGVVLIYIFSSGMSPFMQIYITEQFPTDLRGKAAGICEASVRLFGGVLGVGVIPYIFAAKGVNGVFTVVATLSLACIVPVMIWGRETAGKSMEEASAE